MYQLNQYLFIFTEKSIFSCIKPIIPFQQSAINPPSHRHLIPVLTLSLSLSLIHSQSGNRGSKPSIYDCKTKIEDRKIWETKAFRELNREREERKP